MYARIVGGVLAAAAVCGPAFAQGAAAPQAWAAQVEPGNEYRGDFVADDPVIDFGDRRVPIKCAVLPSDASDGFDVSIRQTADNKISNLITLSLMLQVGVGTCSDFKLIRSSAYDPSAVLAPGDNGRVRFYSGGGAYVIRVLTMAREPQKDPFILRVRKLDPSVRARTFEPGAAGLAASAPSPGGAPSASGIEQARSAYLQMCGKGQEKLSAATCAGMRADLDAALAAQAAAAREAEVMGVYRQLCAPGALKLSQDTCDSMLAEAKRSLAAPAAASAPPASAPAPVRASGSAAGRSAAAPSKKVKSAYEELCAPGAEQVSKETCAVLKADAAR